MFIIANPVYLERIRATFVQEGHLVKVEVTGAKMVHSPYSRYVKLR